jgi:hypothetical protein
LAEEAVRYHIESFCEVPGRGFSSLLRSHREC